MSLRFTNGVFRLKGFATAQYEVPTTILANTKLVVAAPEPVAVAEVPTAAPEPEPVAVVEVPAVAPEPEPVAVVEVPTVAPEPEPVAVAEPEPVAAPSEVEAPLEVLEASPETGLVPEDPPTE